MALKRLQSRLLNKYGDFNCVDIMWSETQITWSVHLRKISQLYKNLNGT